MASIVADIRQTLYPDRRSKDGPLPPILVLLTFVTGVVNGFSYLSLGHVFVANMTGNVVLLGFALVGAHGFSVSASVLAIAAFAVGGVVGGRLGAVAGRRRGDLLRDGAIVQSGFLAIAVVLAAFSGWPFSSGYRYGLIAVLAVAMGIQNATVQKLGVPELTTTVLTRTITGVAADSVLGGGKGAYAGRRLVSVGTMLAGAVTGAALVVHHNDVWTLGTALAGVVAVATVLVRLQRSHSYWVGFEG